jgi:competence protein ComEA
MKKLIVLLMIWSCNVFAVPVDINKASAKEIAASLQGVGQKKAAEIVKYRQQHGAFTSLADLSKVKGIGNKTVAKNKKNIKLTAKTKAPQKSNSKKKK